MTNRRDFLKAGAGFLYLQAATPKRREVSIGKRRAKVIDIHGHFVAPEELEVVKDTPLARNVSNNIGRGGTDQQGSLVLGPERLRVLDEAGIDIQVLSHQGGWWYGADRDLARRIVNVQNQKLAEWCSARSDRFAGLASVALQHPEMAAEQLEEAVKKLGLKGVGIAGHAGGEVPFSPKYDPFWAKVQDLGVLVFVHPGGADNVLRDGALRGRGDLGNIIGNPLETTVFLSHMIFEGTLDRFPGVSSANLHAGKAIQSSFENHVGQEDGCLQRISDDVAEIASSAKGAIAQDVIGAAGMHEDQDSQFLHFCPERIVFGRKGYFACGVTGDTDALQSELFDSFFQLFRRHLGMLQSDRCQTRKPIRMRRAPFGELLVLNVNDPPCEIPVCSIPPAALMTQHLDINARLVENPQAFRAQD